MKKSTTIFIRSALLLLLIFNFSKIQAQWKIGVQGGYTNNSLTTSTGFAEARHYESRGGLTIGVPIRYEFLNWLAVQADVSLVQKNYSLTRDENIVNEDFTINKTYYDITNEFIQLPIYAHLSVGSERIKAFLNAGFYMGYWFSSNTKGLTIKKGFGVEYDSQGYHNFDENVPFDSRRDNRFDGGAMLGLGVKYQLNDKIQLLLEGRYYYGFTDLQKEYMLRQVHRYNNTFAVQVGCMFTIGK